MSDGLLTAEQLAERWQLPGENWLSKKRQLLRICTRIGLKPVKLGHRTKRYRPADVERCEETIANPKKGGLRSR